MTTVDDALAALQSADFHIRRGAAAELNRLGDGRSLLALIQALESDPDEWVRIDAAGALGRIGDQRATPALLATLKSADLLANWQREWDQLASITDSRKRAERQQFLWASLVGEISDIRRSAAIALGQLSDPAAVNGLIEALHDTIDPNVRAAAAEALSIIGTPEALDAIGKK